jgi:hypothetical protein
MVTLANAQAIAATADRITSLNAAVSALQGGLNLSSIMVQSGGGATTEVYSNLNLNKADSTAVLSALIAAYNQLITQYTTALASAVTL